MGSVNAINTNTDLSVRVFDSFYSFSQNVPADEYDVVNSYFRSVFGTTDAAGNFTVTLFRIAAQSKIPVLTLLQRTINATGTPVPKVRNIFCRTKHLHQTNH